MSQMSNIRLLNTHDHLKYRLILKVKVDFYQLGHSIQPIWIIVVYS